MHKTQIDKMRSETHFVLVHGACHGAWSWYKLKPRLEAAGHRVTALDMAASGVNMKFIHDVPTALDYTEPLLKFMASVPEHEQVVLVGHSLGGLNLALAMELFPHKISLAIFMTAFLPDTINKPSYVLDQFLSRSPKEMWMDTQFSTNGTSNQTGTTVVFGHNFLASKLYQLSPIEDLELAKALTREGSLFVDDLSTNNNLSFTNEKYGSVKRAFVVCKEDQGIPEEFQKWMIENAGGVAEVIEIEGADHMAMLSKPQELSDGLLDIVTKTHS